MLLTLHPPDCCTIRCPKCSGKATFSGSMFLYRDASLSKHAIPKDMRLPKNFPWKQSNVHPYLQWRPECNVEQWGILSCPNCGRAGRHRLNWPEEAYYTIEIGGRKLWATNREFLAELLRFVDNPRNSTPSKLHPYNLKIIPRVFYQKRHRKTLKRKLMQLLENT